MHKYRSAVLFLGMILGMLLTPVTAAWAAQLNDIRIGLQEEATRFVIELDEEVPFRIFNLSKPERLVIDLPAVTWRSGITPNFANSVITQYRTGLFKKGVNRIVLDLNNPVQLVRSDSLADENRFRIVLDMAPITAEQSVSFQFASSGWDNYETNVAPLTASNTEQKLANGEKPVIVIDPGHGGVDPGGVVEHIQEKHIVLSFAKLLKTKLDATGRYRAVLTRDKDIYIPLRERFKIADHENADMFISIHADKIHVKTIRGLTIYTLSEKASDEESAALAQQANRADVLLNDDLNQYDALVSDILIDRAQEWTAEQSWRVAKLMVRHLRTRSPIARKAHRYAGFAVLKSPNVPSILLELGYLTNESDLKNLQSRNFKDKVATGMIEGLDAYFKELKE